MNIIITILISWIQNVFYDSQPHLRSIYYLQLNCSASEESSARIELLLDPKRPT